MGSVLISLSFFISKEENKRQGMKLFLMKWKGKALLGLFSFTLCVMQPLFRPIMPVFRLVST